MSAKAAKQGHWNIWWTLSTIFLALAVVIGILEVLGFFRDIGIVLSILSMGLSLYFGLAASTRSSIGEFRGEVLPRLDRIVGILDERLPR